MERPRCPRPGHERGRVVRNGTYGTDEHRRPRWKCVPPNGDGAHEFTEAMPRQFGVAGFCIECERDYAEAEGPQTPRAYSFTTKDIANALVRLGKGESYRSVSWSTRGRAGRWPRSQRKRVHRTSHGQLAADFVEVFAPVVFEPHRRWDWPDRGSVLLDAAHFRVNTGVQGGAAAFCILAAMGYDPERHEQVVWSLRAVRGDDWGPTTADWSSFLHSLGGAPPRVVCDQDTKLLPAVRSVWPGVEVYFCELHLRNGAAGRLQKNGYGDPALPVQQKLEVAFRSVAAWQEFVSEARALRHPDVTKYIKQLDRVVMTQLPTRGWPSAGHPVATGALEERLRQLKGAFKSRAGRLRNQERLNRLLMLFQLELNGHADANAYSRTIHDWLLANDGRPKLRRRAIADTGRRHALGS